MIGTTKESWKAILCNFLTTCVLAIGLILGSAQLAAAQAIISNSLWNDNSSVYAEAYTRISYGDALYYDVCLDANLTLDNVSVASTNGCNDLDVSFYWSGSQPLHQGTYNLSTDHYVAAYYQIYVWVNEIVGWYWVYYDPYEVDSIINYYYNIYIPVLHGTLDLFTFWYLIYLGYITDLPIPIYDWVYEPTNEIQQYVIYWGSLGSSLTAGGDPTPVISSISPDTVDAWSVVNVTITGTGFGSSPTLEVSPSFPVTITSASDTSISAIFDLSEVDEALYGVSVVSHGYDGNGFVSAVPGASQNSNAAAIQVVAGAPEIRMLNNGNSFPYFGVARITATPAMPVLKARLVRPDGSVLRYGTVHWLVHFWYQANQLYNGQNVDSPVKESFIPLSGTVDLAADQEFNITAALNGAFVGGYVTVNAQYRSRQAEFLLSIKGDNPSASQIKTRPVPTISPLPWFFWKIGRKESGHTFFQFNENASVPAVIGFPIFGFPDGWGLMQIDRSASYPTELQVMWNWASNVDAAGTVLVTKQNEMGGGPSVTTNEWEVAVSQRKTYNNDNSHPDAPLALKVTGLNGIDCTFSMDDNGVPLNSGHHSFYDAIWIKRYNGNSGGGSYIYWKNTGLQPGESPHFDYHELNVKGINYVQAVCGEPAP